MGFLVGFLKKWTKSAKSEAISGVLHSGVGSPSSNGGPHQGVACPHRGVAERGLEQASGTPQRSSATQLRRGVATVHSMKISKHI